MAGLATAFGSGAMTNSFEDFPKAKMFFIIGSNTTEAHPVAATFLKQAMRDGAKMIVVDPRYSGIAEHATLHVPIRVGSDVAFSERRDARIDHRGFVRQQIRGILHRGL